MAGRSKSTLPLLGQPRVHKIVVTGGPCAGKTTAMSKLSLRLSSMGFQVFVVPELATMTITGGAQPGTMGSDEFVAWETSILRGQMALEDMFEEIARECALPRHEHAVLLCDRGTMDVLAYMGREAFAEVLQENRWTIPQLRDQRYEAVVHLQTAAIGAEAHYTLANNAARSESRAEAIELDSRLVNAWVGHNALSIIDNPPGGDFEDKMVRTLKAVCDGLGVPAPRAAPHWWIVDLRQELDIPHTVSEVEHTFLKTSNADSILESRVTRRSQPDATIYYHREIGPRVTNASTATTHGHDDDSVRARSERAISLREYKALLKQADPERIPIRKTRRAFIWNNEYYLLDTFHEPASCAGVTTLFLEKPVKAGTTSATELPPFVRLIEDVTTKPWFSNHAHNSWERTKNMIAHVQSQRSAS